MNKLELENDRRDSIEFWVNDDVVHITSVADCYAYRSTYRASKSDITKIIEFLTESKKALELAEVKSWEKEAKELLARTKAFYERCRNE